MRPRAGDISIAQLMIASAMAVGVSLIVAKLSQNSIETSRRSMDGYYSLEMRDTVANISRDPVKWLDYQYRADALNEASVFSNCLKKGGPYVCPTNDSSLSSDAAIQKESDGRATFPTSLYVPNRLDIAPGLMTTTNFTKIAGTPSSPAYFDRDGKPCAGSTNAKCVRMTTAYLMRQHSATNSDPGAVAILVKMQQNPTTLQSSPNAIKTTYNKINIGTMWNSGAKAAVPVGTIIPFAGTSANLPQGYLICNGAKLNRSDYPFLYEILKTRWTPAGAPALALGEFYLPDLRGLYLRGLDLTPTTSPAVDPDRDIRVTQPYQAQEIFAHSHVTTDQVVLNGGTGSGSGPVSINSHTLNMKIAAGTFAAPSPWPAGFSIFDGGAAGRNAMGAQPVAGTINVGNSSAPASGGTTTVTASVGNSWVTTPSSATAVEIRPSTAFVNYIIRADY